MTQNTPKDLYTKLTPARRELFGFTTVPPSDERIRARARTNTDQLPGFHLPSEKEMSISRYKRGFGGNTIPVHSGEYFYQVGALERTLEKRFQQLTQAHRTKLDRAQAV